MSRLLIFRSQYPERPPSSFGIHPHRKNTKKSIARMNESAEKTQMIKVNSIPDKMSA